LCVEILIRLKVYVPLDVEISGPPIILGVDTTGNSTPVGLSLSLSFEFGSPDISFSTYTSAGTTPGAADTAFNIYTSVTTASIAVVTTVAARPPPTGAAIADTYPAARAAVTYTDSPAPGVRIVSHGDAPGGGTRIVHTAAPTHIDVTCAVYNRAAIDITAEVSRCVSYVHDSGCVTVHVHIPDIINGVTRRYSVDFGRH
jgi:hypothetical protein